ncbi:MAG TPA: hypothetical protein DCX06_02880 [Opitutae bacterium]|nr:hypothetical protein [Opitutae bacterium]
MNKIYDKLLLAIAVLALLAGVGLYVTKSGAVPQAKPQGSAQAADNPYANVPVPESSSADVSWPEAPKQAGSGWIYDVFTPPKIYLLPDGTFTAEDPTGRFKEVPFGVYLADIKQEPYRIQIEGYIEEDLSDASKSLILLYDEENQKSIRARVGGVVSAAEFKVLDFQIKRISDPKEGIYKEATAKILDQRTNEEVVLKHGERLYDDDVIVVIRSKQDTTVDIELTQAGATFETDLGQYVLKEIKLEESAVTVEKLGNEDREAETRRLTLQSSAPAAVTPEPSTDTSSESDALEFNF